MVSDSAPAALLVHDGELADVGVLIEQLGLRVEDRRETAGVAIGAHGFSVIVGTPSRLVEFGALEGGPDRIAILEKESRTARSMLLRSGVSLQVRSPFHPEAMRLLLLLHAIYNGPEKRQSVRVPIGASIRIKAGFRKKPATLADISVRGCRLLGAQIQSRGSTVKMLLSADLMPDGKPLSLKGRWSAPCLPQTGARR